MASREFVLGLFDDERKLREGLRRLRKEGFQVEDVLTPYPVHGIDEALGLQRSQLPIVTFVVGFAAMTLSMLFQLWTSGVDWPINVGGKPNDSILAFLPVTFELTVLLGGLATAAAFFFRCRLFPGAKVPLAAISTDPRITDDLFVVVLERKDAAFREEPAWKIFHETGAVRVEERVVVT